MHENPTNEKIDGLLRDSTNIAVVGLSDDPSRPSHGVARSLQRAGYRVFPVNPNLPGEVLGERPYASLREIEAPVDIVDVFRRPETVDPVAREAVEIGAKTLWLQLGVVNDEAASLASGAGLAVVMDRCIAIELARLS